ncbi:MAG: ribonuclease HII [Thermoanaerobaculia bacterium]|nr:ribonuclease HII [Thermoanaerobaculia bacterium]
MALDPSQHSIAELRNRLLEEGEPVTSHLMQKLRRDPRRGVQKLHRILERRRAKEKEREKRRESLLHFERILWSSGIERLAGVDESGVGPLAGPVVAAAVMFPPETEIEGVDDSKQLEAETRRELAVTIRERATGVAVGTVSVEEIDELNIYHGALLAMRRAVEGLPRSPQHLLVDAREIPELEIPQNRFDKGDGINFSIAAASIVAKVHRDRLMKELDRRFPEYGFASHKGYGTAEHQKAIRVHGPCPAHRRSFKFIRELCGEYSDRFYELQEQLADLEGRSELNRFETRLSEAKRELPDEEYKKLRLTLTRRWKAL